MDLYINFTLVFLTSAVLMVLMDVNLIHVKYVCCNYNMFTCAIFAMVPQKYLLQIFLNYTFLHSMCFLSFFLFFNSCSCAKYYVQTNVNVICQAVYGLYN